jgi:cytochrome P450
MIRHWFSDVGAFKLDPLALLTRRAQASDAPIIPLALGPSPVVLVNDPSLVKPLMRMSEDVSDKGRLVQKIGAVIGESSLTLSGEAHKKRRAILHERLSRGVATSYVGAMTASIRQVSSQLLKDQWFRADIVGGSLALKLACVALFGHRVLDSKDEMAVMTAFHTIEADLQREMFRFLPRTPWKMRRDMARREQSLATINFVINRVKEAASDSSVLRALRDAGLSETEIRDEITTMIVAGFHTTGAAVAWICYFLTSQPEILMNIRNEYDRLVNAEGEIPADRLPEAKTTIAFVKEVLRLYPSAWWMTRELRQPAEIGGTKLKAGTTLIVAPWVYHRSAKHFANPSVFSLDREHSGAAYLPFGVGPRACVGMGVAFLELQLIALEFAAAFDLSLKTPSAGFTPRAGITLNAPAMEITIRPRSSRADFISVAA